MEEQEKQATPNPRQLLQMAVEANQRKLSATLAQSHALFSKLAEHGNIKPFSGGTKILQELGCSAPGNAQAYAGYDHLPGLDLPDEVTAGEFGIKQYAAPVIVSGLQLAQASGKEKMADLLASALENASTALANSIIKGAMGDGSGNYGKDLTGIQAMVSPHPAATTYAGIDASTTTWWRNKVQEQEVTVLRRSFWQWLTRKPQKVEKSSILEDWMSLYSQLVRGVEHPDLIIAGADAYKGYLDCLSHPCQRVTGPMLAAKGFMNVKFLNAPVVLDLDIPPNHAYFLTTKYIFLRPFGDPNLVSLGTDPEVGKSDSKLVEHLKFYGNLTTSRRAAHGLYIMKGEQE